MLVAAILLGACASRPPADPPGAATVSILPPGARADIDDQRAAFRRQLCDLMPASAAPDGGTFGCDRLLVRVGAEPALSVPVSRASPGPADVHVIVVLGIAWDCLEGLFDPARLPHRRLAQLGYAVSEIHVDGLSGTAHNAQMIAAALRTVDTADDRRRLILIGYSKGASDILEAVVSEPDLAARIDAVVSIAGSIGGSPLADEYGAGSLALLRFLPGAHCGPGDGDALHSMRPDVRQSWIVSHRLPAAPRYYSLVTLPSDEHVNPLLALSHHQLRRIAGRNDGVLLPQDQVIPGAALLGYVDADHWSVALPVDSGQMTDPVRDRLWEAVVRHVANDLAGRQVATETDRRDAR